MLEKSIRMSDTPTPAPSSRPQSTKSNVRQPQGPQQRTSYTNNRNAHTNQPQQQHQQHRQHQSHGTFETSSQASTSHHGQSNTHHNHNSNNNRHDNNHASRYRNTSHQNNMYSLPSPSPLPSPSASSTVSTNSTLSTSSTASAPSSLTLTPRSWILPQIYERFWMNTKTFRDIKLQLSFKAHQNVSADPSYINHQLNQSFEQHNIRTIASGTINQVNKMYLFAHTYHESGLSSPRLSITSTSSSTPFSCQFFIELQIDIVSGHVYMKLKFKPPAQNNLHSTSQINNMANLFSTLANDTMQSVIS